MYASSQQTIIYNELERSESFLKTHLIYEHGLVMEFEPTYNYAAGGYLKRVLNKRITFGLGAQYTLHQQKYKMTVGISNYSEKSRIRLEYLKIPLFAQYSVIAKENYSVFVAAGPQLSMLLSERGSIIEYGDNFDWLGIMHPGGAYREFTLDGIAFMGSEIRLYGTTSFFMQGRIDYSFTDAEKKDAQEMWRGGSVFDIYSYPFAKRPPTHNLALSLSLGLTFQLK